MVTYVAQTTRRFQLRKRPSVNLPAHQSNSILLTMMMMVMMEKMVKTMVLMMIIVLCQGSLNPKACLRFRLFTGFLLKDCNI